MKIECVEGLILSETNYSESSKILNIFTKEHGKIGVLSKGCRNLKSKLRGVSRKLVYGFFHIYYKENGLSTLISVDVLDPLKEIMTDLTKISYVSYLLELVEQVIKQAEDDKEIYSMLISTILKIEEGFSPEILTNILELKLLDSLGVRPMIDGCAYCGSDKLIVTLNSSSGGFVCQNCYHNEKIVDHKTIKLIRMFYYLDISKISKLSVSKEIKKELQEFIDDYYDRYTGLYLRSKQFLKNLNKISSGV